MSDEIVKVCPTFAGLGGKVWPIGRYVSENRNWSACNPSIAYSPKLGYAMTVRSSNYILHPTTGVLSVLEGSEVLSKVWFCELDNDLNPKNMREVVFSPDGPRIHRGVEDPKLFWRDDSWYFTGVMLERDHTPEARMALYKYDQETNTAIFVRKWGSPDASKPEKNWMLPYEPNPNFDFIYGPYSVVKDDLVISRLDGVPAAGGLRGNTNLWLLEDGTYLAVVHNLFDRYTKSEEKLYTQNRAYIHRFATYSQTGELVGLSPEFVFKSLGVEFAAGLVVKDEQLIVSWGERDATSYLASISLQLVLESIKPVGEL